MPSTSCWLSGRSADASTRGSTRSSGVLGATAPDRLTQQGLDPVLIDGALAFEDDLVEVGLGGEPVPAAFQAHVPQGPFEGVTHILDEPARQPGTADPDKHLHRRRA